MTGALTIESRSTKAAICGQFSSPPTFSFRVCSYNEIDELS
jgi:hypothetical protein